MDPHVRSDIRSIERDTLYTPAAVAGTAAGGTLAFTGTALGMQWGWIALGAVVLGGLMVTLTRFGPRVAIDPIRRQDGKYRLKLTKNGQPWQPFRRRGRG